MFGLSRVTPYDGHTKKDLDAKHRYKPPRSMLTTLFSEAPLVVDVDTISMCIKYFPKGTSCGRDGLHAPHILDALYRECSIVARNLLYAILLVVNLWIRGRCLISLEEFVASEHLMSLLKSGGGIRPIDMGSIWRRLISKVFIKRVNKDVAHYLNDFLFGVGVSSGVEPILHNVNMVLSKRHVYCSLDMFAVDF